VGTSSPTSLDVTGGGLARAPGLHPTRTRPHAARPGSPVGWVGEIDPDVLAAHGSPERVGWLEVDLDALLAPPRRPAYRPVSRFPSSDIDLAFEVPEAVPAAELAGPPRGGG
jgi:phenylalanyl-tRNA synthetase beta chain